MLLRVSPGVFRRVINWWPPFRAAGIRLAELSPDWRYARVELRMRRLNRNFVGTHFGGSLFAMTDPMYMIMLLHLLGDDYVIWDQSAEIEYVAPGRGTVSAEFRLDDAHLQRLRHEAADGSKLLPEYPVEVRDAQGVLVARVRKKLYVRLKKHLRPATA